ncbi:hypothetical protein V6N12_032936 [Hibiscus sabdariffa]|uniref:Uncharacterized protein n=1 Tax=Hibiscus sabdariffa TaxID=183260 RepID=A0ABR2BCX7_9ROSI
MLNFRFYLRNYHIKAWIKCNLTNPKMFAKKPIDWELMFGGVCCSHPWWWEVTVDGWVGRV